MTQLKNDMTTAPQLLGEGLAIVAAAAAAKKPVAEKAPENVAKTAMNAPKEKVEKAVNIPVIVCSDDSDAEDDAKIISFAGLFSDQGQGNK